MLAAPQLRRVAGLPVQHEPQALTHWLQQHLGVELQGQRPVGGGCIHHAWALQLVDGQRLFAKTNRAALLPLLEAEADGLEALRRAAGPLQIPQPLALGTTDGGEAVLVLSWLELQAHGGGQGRAWWQLGAQLAQLHRGSLDQIGDGFGWGRDNFIGSGPQANGWMGSWCRFFSERRLAPQLQQAERSGQRLPGASTLLQALPQWLGDHQPDACLVHGDLWSGNAGLLADGGGALFDPAVYRGDREVDLAMAQLFGGFPPAFFEGYDATWPRPAGHQQRSRIYNLYHQLNHANLFGGGYWRQAAATITDLLKQAR